MSKIEKVVYCTVLFLIMPLIAGHFISCKSGSEQVQEPDKLTIHLLGETVAHGAGKNLF